MTTQITQHEMQIVEKLSEAWNLFMKLPVEHPMAQDEFCRAIHRCQDMVLARSGLRQMNIPSLRQPRKKVQLRPVE